MEIDSKVCMGCKENKLFTEFTTAKLGKYGLRSKCKNCRALEAVEYNTINKEKVSEYGKKYRKEKAEQISAQRAVHTLENKQKLSEYARQYRLSNPGKINAKTARRRAQKRKATPHWLTEDHWKQIEQFYIEAAVLKIQTAIPHEVDHQIPLVGKNVCGLHVPWNLKVITRNENRKKSRKC